MPDLDAGDVSDRVQWTRGPIKWNSKIARAGLDGFAV
jgi:hypothetical protein